MLKISHSLLLLPSSSSVSTSPSSSLSSSPLSLNPPSSSFSPSVSFSTSSTSEVRVSLSYFNSSVFCLTTCLLLCIGFRSIILLANTFIDLLIWALVFLKNVNIFNKQFSKFIMCYKFNCRLVFDLYIIFQSFRTVFITQKLDSNFKYQLHYIIACVTIIILNRFLNLRRLINLSSFTLLKLAFRKERSERLSYSNSSWVLPINKYDY